MSIGTPIVFTEGTEKRGFAPLSVFGSGATTPIHSMKACFRNSFDATPNVLPVARIPAIHHEPASLGREIPLDLGGFLGRIDNLLVTNDGYLVIRETKLYRNPRRHPRGHCPEPWIWDGYGQICRHGTGGSIKHSQSPALHRRRTSAIACLVLLASKIWAAVLADNFDEALERHLQRGEILLLIVSDGIHVGSSGSRTHWLETSKAIAPLQIWSGRN